MATTSSANTTGFNKGSEFTSTLKLQNPGSEK